MIHTPVNISGGYVEIDDGDGKFLSSIDLPPPRQAWRWCPSTSTYRRHVFASLRST